MTILETERLVLRELEDRDAVFTLELLNSPKFLKYIGDRGVRSIEQAADFVENRYRASYREHGYGLYAVVLKETAIPIGICGFVKRPEFERPDIGFALLPEFERGGYAYEASAAAMEYGRRDLGFSEVLAITTLDNSASVRLLEKLGFTLRKIIDHNGERLNLFSNSIDR